ncbi:MAG: site-specific integrase, partial [Pseudomonadota bacterium]
MTGASAGAIDLMRRWCRTLGAVHGLDLKTIDVYSRAVRGYVHFLTGHLGQTVGRASLGDVSVRDLRAWMAAERRRGLGARSIAKEISALRSFYGWLEDAEGLACPAIHAIGPPKSPARLPRPVAADDARDLIDTVSADRQPWVTARDQAALTLIWGAGLRISEALSLRQRD